MAPWQVKRVWVFVDSHLADRLTLGCAAAQARLSNSYFSRAFKASFGTSFTQFVKRKRIERAKTLMTTTMLRLSEVACATGFSDQAHFSRAFRQVMGTTPARWRRHFAQRSVGPRGGARTVTPIYGT
jgi:AraC family transcriptional regulator